MGQRAAGQTPVRAPESSPAAGSVRSWTEHLSPGTLAGGLHALAPLFEPLDQALVGKLRSEPHWHADETRWAVFVDVEGKVGHRWYLWVFHSRSVVHYVLDESRSAAVVEAELTGVDRGFISCDRYVAYKKFARLHPGVVLAFCWAHQRRDFLGLGNDYPALWRWAMGWVDAIAELYHLNGLRLQARNGSAARAAHHADLQQAVQRMADARNGALADPLLAEPAAKVLRSMTVHWTGLTVFVDHPGGAHGQQRRRTRRAPGRSRRQELLRLGRPVVGPTGRYDVQRAADGQAMATQCAHLAWRLPASLCR